MKNKTLLLVLQIQIVLLPFLLSGQFDVTIQSHVPATPTAAAFAKYAEVPVNMYTGVPNISLALYSLADNRVVHNLSLSYHGSGIKSSEISSSVGLGWSLNAGGVITRSIRGSVDERLYDNQISGYYTDGVDEAWFDNSLRTAEIMDGRRDIESDLYYYNFGSYSGSFYFDNIGNIVERDKSDLIITPINTGYSYNKLIWKIVTPDGNIYHFGDNTISDGVTDDAVSYSQHYTQPKNMVGSPTRTNPLVDSWFLVQIESYDHKSKLDFIYDEYEAYSFRNVGTSITSHVDEDGRNIIDVSSSSFASRNPILATESLTPRLTEIKSSEITVTFHYSTESRRDLDDHLTPAFHPRYVVGVPSSKIVAAQALDYIRINSNTNVCLKRFDFAQTYFTSPSTGFTETLGLSQKTDAFGTYYSDMRRLRLLSMSEQSCDLAVAKVHCFLYNSNSIQRRLTYAQDHHGYPNGETDNITLLPKLTIQGTANEVPKIDLSHISALAEREPVSFYTEQAMLKSITLPTGGTTTFDYEGHSYFTSEVAETGSTIVDLRNSKCSSPLPPASCSTCCQAETLTSSPITLDPSNTVRHEMRVTVIKTPNDGSNSLIEVPVEIKPGTGAWQLLDEIVLDTNNEFDVIKCYSELTFPNSNNGQYQFRISATSGRKLFMQLLLKKYVRSDVFINKAVGGLRIKTITDDPIDGDPVVRSFDYTTAEGNTNSSGKLIGIPTYLEDLPADAQFFLNGQYCVDLGYRFSSGNSFSLGTVMGSHIGYKRVTQSVSSGNGYTENIYYDDPTHDPRFIRDFPALPEHYIDHLAGYTSQINQYHDNGTLLSSEAHTYSTYEYATTNKSYVLRSYQTCPNSVIIWNNYAAESKYVYLNKIVASLDGVTTTTEFIHGFSDHPTLMTESKMTNSDGKVYKTSMFYANTYADDTDVKNEMIAKNLLLPAWKTEKRVDNVLVDGNRIIWHYYSNLGSDIGTGFNYPLLIYPNRSERYEATWNEAGVFQSGSWDLQKTINKYNADRGLPSEIITNGWADPHTYTYSPSGKMTSHTFKNYISTLTYYTDSDLPLTMTIPDGTSTTYTYDGLLRLSQIKDDQRNVTTDIDYCYNNGGSGKTYIQQLVTYPTLGDATNVEVKTRSFVDGLGRPIQVLKINQAPNSSQHIVVNTEYDDIGRVARQYEPFAISGGSELYSNATTSEFTQNSYEPSPLNRLSASTPPSWYATTFDYGKNTSTVAGFSANTLNKFTNIDANNNKIATYTDKRGREVLMRKLNSSGGGANDTETIWDHRDRKSKILPPGATEATTNLIYHFVYYPSGLLKIRDLPDAEPIKYVYNDREFLAYHQDGEMDNDNRWLARKYDNYGRGIAQGFNNTSSDLTITNETFADAILSGQTLISHVYGNLGVKIDKIDFSEVLILGTSGTYITKDFEYDNSGRISALVKDALSNPFNATLQEQFVYDSQDNVVQKDVSTNSHNQTNGFTKSYDFDHVGRQISESIQKSGNPIIQQLSSTTYTAKDQIKDLILNPELGLMTFHHNYLPNGFMTEMKDMSSSAVFDLDLHYDIPLSGGTVRKNGDISSMKWKVLGQNEAHYNYAYDYLDRLTVATYFSSGANGAFNTSYGYNPLGCITSLTRNGTSTTNATGESSQSLIDDLRFSLKPNSNQIQSITDYGSSKHGFKSNGIAKSGTQSGAEGPTGFTYDDNGAVIADNGRNITYIRNHLNLPMRIDKTNNNDYIEYHYDAEGVLHTKEISENSSISFVCYLGDFEFDNINLKLIHFSDGYLKASGSINYTNGIKSKSGTQSGSEHTRALEIHTTQNVTNTGVVIDRAKQEIEMNNPFEVNLGGMYTGIIDPNADVAPPYAVHYIIRDHLGNTRVIVNDSNTDGMVQQSEIVQVSHYYPFGAEFSTSVTGDYAWRRLGGEKELGLDLNLHNHPFRQYDPLIGQWTGPDMLSEWTPSISPYHYSNNNPVNYIDPFGLFASRAEARRYRRENRLKGRVRKNKKTGRFEIKSKGSDGLITQLADGTIDFSVSASFTGAQVKAYKPNVGEQIKDYNAVSGFFFEIADNINITVQSFNPLDTRVQSFTGEIITNNERRQMALGGVTK